MGKMKDKAIDEMNAKPRMYAEAPEEQDVAYEPPAPNWTDAEIREAFALLKEIYVWTRHKKTPWAERAQKLVSRIR